MARLATETLSTSRLYLLASATLLGFLALLGAAPAADAARPLVTGFAEPEYKLTSERNFLLNKTVAAEAKVVRIDVNWRGLTSGKPANATNPADKAYNFATIDGAVKAARAKRLQVLLSVRFAPSFAEGPDKPAKARDGTWKPIPGELGKFATALAKRYSGSFPDPAGGKLPRVTHYQGWNEWTSEVWLAPAYQGDKLFSPGHYRKMIRAFFAGVKKVRRKNVVVTGGTNPSGTRAKNRRRIRPLVAYRELFCLKRSLKPKKGCAKPAQFDALDHHAINTSGAPTQGAAHRDDASSGDVRKVVKALRAAERAKNVRPGSRKKVWVTESWFESNPPDKKRGVRLAKQARWVQQNLYVLWRQGVTYVMNIQVRDTKIDKSRPAHTLQGGLLFADSRPKPAFTAFRFPFVGDRKSERKVLIWGKAPRKGGLRIQVRKGGWKTLKRIPVGDNKTFATRVPLRKKRGAYKLRGKVGPQTSLVWRQR